MSRSYEPALTPRPLTPAAKNQLEEAWKAAIALRASGFRAS
jgi:hypothetical protein